MDDYFKKYDDLDMLRCSYNDKKIKCKLHEIGSSDFFSGYIVSANWFHFISRGIKNSKSELEFNPSARNVYISSFNPGIKCYLYDLKSAGEHYLSCGTSDISDSELLEKIHVTAGFMMSKEEEAIFSDYMDKVKKREGAQTTVKAGRRSRVMKEKFYEQVGGG